MIRAPLKKPKRPASTMSNASSLPIELKTGNANIALTPGKQSWVKNLFLKIKKHQVIEKLCGCKELIFALVRGNCLNI